MPYVNTALSRNIFPKSVDAINKAITQAKVLNLAKRDVRPLMSILAAIPQADPDILADMQTRKNSITGFDWHIAPGVPSNAPSAPDVEVQRAAAIQQRFRESGLHNEIDTLLNGLFFGIAMIESPWEVNARGENAILTYEVVEGVDVRLDPASPTRWSKYTYANPDDSDKFVIAQYPQRESFIIATSNPMKGVDNNYTGGLFRAIVWFVYIKYMHWWFWSRGGERVGMMTHRPVYTNEGALAAVWDWLKKIADHAVELPDDIKVAIKGLTDDQQPDHKLYNDLIDSITARSQRLILGQDVVNSAMNKTGSYAKAKEANKTTLDYNWSDIIWLQNILTDQYVLRDYTMNYGVPTTGVYPRFELITDEAEDYKTNAMILSQAESAGWRPTNAEEVSRRIGFTVERVDTTPIIGE